MKTLSITLLFISFIASTSYAVEPDVHDAGMLQAITNLRQKQEGEENNPVRVIQQPITTRVVSECTPSEQVRQRLRDLGSEHKRVGVLNIDAGHGDVRIDGNTGQINNSVNVEVVNANDRKCF